MKLLELSSKENRNGRRKFKAILHRIFPDSCVDEVNGVGTQYNENGVTWIREYCERALPTIEGMSIRAEFANDDRTELLGHGDTGICDGEPIFENAVQIGVFQRGYIDEVETEDGPITVCIGEGEIDASCYHNLVLELESGNYPSGSVEFMRTAENDAIVYKYGYKDYGRIPTEFIYSGYALLGVRPADENAKLIELNEKQREEKQKMNENEIKDIVTQVVSELNDSAEAMRQLEEQCAALIAEANTARDAAIAEKNSAVELNTQLQSELDTVKAENAALTEQVATLQSEVNACNAERKKNELNQAIAGFSASEIAYAQTEIDKFNENPIESEINSVVAKIYEGIGKAAHNAQAPNSEQQSAETTIEDIFTSVEVAAAGETESIF